jgi:hypothetical protein
MASRVLFLDVDGVLNQCGHHQDVLTAKAAMVRRIVEQTGCTIVVSSTWRRYDDLLGLLKKLLRQAEVEIAGCTPCLDRRTAEGVYIATERGEEIQAWLDENPGVDRFVILDDAADMAHLVGHLVQTDSSVGLTEELADETIRRLNAKQS